MKYKISIEGGFTGIPKEYLGEVNLDEEDENRLLHAIAGPEPKGNLQLRDGLTYKIILQTDTLARTAIYDESNVPESIRDFIKSIREKGNTGGKIH